MDTTRSVSLLRDPVFARLWFVQAATQVGGNMALYALTVLVFATTRSSTAVSALAMSFLVPPIFLSAIAGVVVDRLDVRWALLAPNIVRALLTLGLAVAGTNIAVLLALNLGVGLTTVVLTPAEAAMIPRVVGRDRLETAMGIFNLTLQAAFVVGFAFLGPLMVALAGPSAVLGVVTVLYVAATIACFALPTSPPLPAPPGEAGRALHAAMAQLREGFAAIRDNRDVSRPLLHLATSASLVGVLGVLGPGLAASLGLPPDQLVVIVLPLGLGVIAGVLGLRTIGRGVSRRRAAEGALGGLGVLAAAIALAGPLAERLQAGVADPGRRRPGLLRRGCLRRDGRLRADSPVRGDAAPGSGPDLRRAGFDRQRRQPGPGPGRRPAGRPRHGARRHRRRQRRGRGDGVAIGPPVRDSRLAERGAGASRASG